MDELFIDLGISAILRMLQTGTKAKKWRKAMLKIFAAIARTYKADQEFHDAAEKGLNG
jgi:predicted secreted protein